MTWPFTLLLVAGSGVLALSGYVWRRCGRHVLTWWLSLGLAGFAVEGLLGWLRTERRMFPEAVWWMELQLVVNCCVTAPWILFSAGYGRGDGVQWMARWKTAAVVIGGAPLPLLFVFRDFGVLVVQGGEGSGLLRLGWSAHLLVVLSILGSLCVLVNLEHTFRSSVGVMRWRMKYVVIGVSALFVMKALAGSWMLVWPDVRLGTQMMSAVSLLVSCGLLGIGLGRGAWSEVDVYPSKVVLHRSLTVLLASLYLVAMGFLMKVARRFEAREWLVQRTSLAVLSLIPVLSLLLSERIRRRVRQFVSFHFRRPAYDYRRIWSEFTGVTAQTTDESSYGRAVVSWTSETFKALSVNLWVLGDGDRKLKLVGSSVLAAGGEEGRGLKEATMVIPESMVTHVAAREPLDIDRSEAPWAVRLRSLHASVFPNGGGRIGLPLVSGGELRGFLTLGDRVAGAAFTGEDLELLACVGDQISASLTRIQLSRAVIAAKELEAFQSMSAFFVHDLKNTANTLSLTLQNLREHFGNPEYREDALRSVARSVGRIDDLIQRLGQLRREFAIRPRAVQLTDLVRSAVEKAGNVPGIRVDLDLQPVPVLMLDADQIESVILNLLLNAREAMVNPGCVSITTHREDRFVVLTVRDEGQGMTPEFISMNLFRPFQTTKKRGLGIGMFQSKTIVEAHRGRIGVESAVGVGTVLTVRLPMTEPE